MNLHETINHLTTNFTDSLVTALRGAPIGEIAAFVEDAPATPKNGTKPTPTKPVAKAKAQYGVKQDGSVRKRRWPTCEVTGCKLPFFPFAKGGGRRCRKHAKAQPKQKKAVKTKASKVKVEKKTVAAPATAT